MGYLCKYLKDYGWEPVVLTEDIEDEHAFTFLVGKTPVTYIPFVSATRTGNGKRKWLVSFLRDMLFNYKDKRMFREAVKLYQENPYDLVLCSSFRTFPLRAAAKVARKYKIPLVTDLRDIIEQYTGTDFISRNVPAMGGLDKKFVDSFREHNLNIRNNVLAKSDHVTTVSPWHVEKLKVHNPNTSLIYNGYDPEIFYPQKMPTPHFIITYTGRIVSTAMRDPELLFRALALLIKEKVIYPADCQVHWYVDDDSWEIISEEAEKANVLSYMIHKGYVSASKIPLVLNSSSILLILTNKAGRGGPKGAMTTKFFESLAVEKPILCVRSDESYLAEAIEETNAGLSATSVDEVCDFLTHHYQEWKHKGSTSSSIDRSKLQSYSRKEQAGQFAHIFDQLTTPVKEAE